MAERSIRRPGAIRQLRHPLFATGKSGDRSRIPRRAQGDGRAMAEAGGTTRRLRPPTDCPRPDSKIAAGAFWVQGLKGSSSSEIESSALAMTLAPRQPQSAAASHDARSADHKPCPNSLAAKPAAADQKVMPLAWLLPLNGAWERLPDIRQGRVRSCSEARSDLVKTSACRRNSSAIMGGLS